MWTIPLGSLITPPPQWKVFSQMYPDQITSDCTTLCGDHDQLIQSLEPVNTRVNKFGYRSDVTDTWHAYDLDKVTDINELPSFDCDDISGTKRLHCARVGVPLSAVRPTLCEVPPSTYDGFWTMHMVNLVFHREATLVMDNMLPWIHRWDESVYRWIACVGPNGMWQWCGRKWGREN